MGLYQRTMHLYTTEQYSCVTHSSTVDLCAYFCCLYTFCTYISCASICFVHICCAHTYWKCIFMQCYIMEVHFYIAWLRILIANTLGSLTYATVPADMSKCNSHNTAESQQWMTERVLVKWWPLILLTALLYSVLTKK